MDLIPPSYRVGTKPPMSTDTPAAAPITADREALAILASFVHEVLMGVYEDDEKKLIHDARRALERSGLLSLTDVVALSAPAPCLICAANHYCPQHNPAPVAAQPAVSGVDALWVERALQLVASYAAELTDDYDPSEARMDAAHEALRTHLSTALGGKING